MSVSCRGRTRVLEQLGEKQDFEAELSGRGFRHEDFELNVDVGASTGSSGEWDPTYEVKMTHAPTRITKIYKAGPRERWVARFAQDLLSGIYGEPTVRSKLTTNRTHSRP